MMRRYSALWVVFIVAICAFAVSFRRHAHAASSPLVMVVSTAVPVQDVSLAVLRRMFQGEATDYAPGKRYIPVNQAPKTTTRTQFDRAVLGMTPDEVGRFWIDRRIRDQPGPPKIVPSLDLALRLVMSLPGAIAYMPAEMVNPKVRVLMIDGKRPGDAGYLLK